MMQAPVPARISYKQMESTQPQVNGQPRGVNGQPRGVAPTMTKPQRKSIRLRGYDYSQAGFYFITICTQNRVHLFGEIPVGAGPCACPDDGPCACPKMVLNDAGKMVSQIWHEIPDYYDGFDIHEFIVMPNHIHGIIEITTTNPVQCPNNGNFPANGQPANGQTTNGQPRDNGQPQGGAPTGLGDIVHRLKTLTTKRYIDGVKQYSWQRFDKRLWQRNYWEHIIRNDGEYRRIAQYIIYNPAKWGNDKLNGGIGNHVMEPPAIYNKEPWMV